MSGKLRLNGGISGFSEITAPDVAGDQTFTLPAVGGTLSTVDYQEGFWTPSCDIGTLNYTNANTAWTRIGNLVTVKGQVFSFTGTTADTINIINLPYNAPSGQAAGCCLYQFGKAGYSTVYVVNSTGFVGGVLQFYSTSASNWDAFKYSNIQSSEFYVYFQATYTTDDTTFVPINGATIS